MSMKLIPSSTARRSTRIASSWSFGSPQIPLPVIRIAPNPRRHIGNSPPIRNSPLLATGKSLPEIPVPLAVVVLLLIVLPLVFQFQRFLCSSWSGVSPAPRRGLIFPRSFPFELNASLPKLFDARAIREGVWNLPAKGASGRAPIFLGEPLKRGTVLRHRRYPRPTHTSRGPWAFPHSVDSRTTSAIVRGCARKIHLSASPVLRQKQIYPAQADQ